MEKFRFFFSLFFVLQKCENIGYNQKQLSQKREWATFFVTWNITSHCVLVLGFKDQISFLSLSKKKQTNQPPTHTPKGQHGLKIVLSQFTWLGVYSHVGLVKIWQHHCFVVVLILMVRFTQWDWEALGYLKPLGKSPIMHQTGHTRIYCATLACIWVLQACHCQ